MPLGKHLLGCLVGCAGLLAVSSADTLLVGARGATLEQVRQTVASRGEVGAKNGDGFFEVRLKDSSARQDLKRKFPYVFDASASTVDKDSLPSLQRHIEYLRARSELLAHSPEIRPSAGFYEALAYYLEPRVGPDGTIDQDAVMRAVKHRDAMPVAWVGSSTRAPSATFTYMGPKSLSAAYQLYFGIGPVSGRVNGIAYAKSNPNIIYLATAGAGAWKSVDQGVNWSFLSNGWMFLHTNSVAVHPTNPNLVLVGTGDYKGFFSVLTQGIMRSTDGGATWTAVGKTFANSVVTRVMFHPDNPNIVLALTGSSTGRIWRSTDAGVTWTATNAVEGRWDDIDFGPVNSKGTRQIWAVGGNNEAGGRIAMSTNQGVTWATINEPTVGVQSVLDIACSKKTIGKVWVMYPNSSAVFRTTNSGTNWTNLSLTSNATFPNHRDPGDSYNWRQRNYDSYVETALYGDTEILYVGLITLASSADDGTTWTDVARGFREDARMHVDQHCFTPHPKNGSIGLAGNDGGVFRVVNVPGDTPTTTSLNAKLFATQHYHVSVHPESHGTYMMAGAQDNATPASRGLMDAWSNLYGGDGGWSAFLPSNPNVHFTTGQRGAVYRYATSLANVPTEIRPPTTAGTAFIAPLVIADSGRVLIGAQQRVQRWSFSGTLWYSSADFSTEMRTLAVAPSNLRHVYAGGFDGSIRKSTDNGENFSPFRRAAFAPVSALAVSWTNDDDLLVGHQGPEGGLFRTTGFDLGRAWTNVSGVGATGLPASPINAVARDPHQSDVWYVGTDVGAFMTTNGGQTWTNMNPLGLGNIHVNAFAIPPDKTYLYVATFGRGVWRIPLVNNQLTAFEVNQDIVLGDQPITATLRLTHPAPQGTTVKLASASPHVTIPSSLDFPAGTTERTFTIQTNQVFSSPRTAIVFATCMGATLSRELTILPYPTVASLTIPRNYMYGGSWQYATATLSAPAPLAGSLTFTDDSPFLSVQSPITVGFGQSQKLTTVSTTNPSSMQTVTITASYKGTTRTLTVYVYPMPVIKSVSMHPIPLIGGFVGTATVTLQQPAPITTEIAIAESSPYVTIPSPRTLQAGQTLVNIPVYSINPLQDETIGFNARIVGDPAAPKPGTIDLRRSQLTSLSVSLNPISGGKKAVLTVTHNLPLPVSRVISLSSSNPAVASVPAGVTMIASSTSATATVTTYAVTQSTTVTLTASFNGTTRQTTLTVNP